MDSTAWVVRTCKVNLQSGREHLLSDLKQSCFPRDRSEFVMLTMCRRARIASVPMNALAFSTVTWREDT